MQLREEDHRATQEQLSSSEIGPENVSVRLKPRVKQPSLWRNRYIASLMVVVAVSYLGVGMVAPIRTLYARAEGAGGGEVGLMAAAYLFSAFVFLFPFGWLSDRYNRVYIIVGGLVGHSLVTLAYLWANTGGSFIGLRFVEGITAAAVLPASRALLADLVPPGRNGEAFGLMSGVMMFDLLAGPPVGTFLAQSVGYTPAYFIAGLSFLPSIIFVLVAFRRYDARPRRNGNDISDLVPANELPLPGSGRLLTGPIVLGCLVRLALGIAPGLGISVWSIYMADLGFSLTLIGWTYTVYAIPILFVSPIAGRLSDRYGRMAMMSVGGVVVGLIWISYGLITAFFVFLLVSVVEGSFDAISRSANDGYLADHSPPASRGRAQGLFNAVTQFASLVSALIAGLLYEVNHSLPFFVLGGLQIGLMAGSIALIPLVQARTKARRPGSASPSSGEAV